MSWVDWLDLTSLVLQLVALVAAPVFVSFGLSAWCKGDKQQATLLFVVGLYLQSLGG